MKKYTIIGNCQILSLNIFLNCNKFFMENYELLMPLNPIQLINNIEIDIFYKNIHLLDLIIIQPISHNYKNNFNTKLILSKIKKECVVIMFPSIYFTGYYPNIIHDNIKDINIQVHDINFIKKFIISKNKESFVNECIRMIEDLNFYSKEFIINIINNSIMNLKNKELEAVNMYNPQYFIKISSFILNNYIKKILFVSLNHQTKYIFRYLSNRILNILNIDCLPYPEELDPQLKAESCIIYDSVKNVINKDLKKNKYSQRELEHVELKPFLEFHYDKYTLVKDYLIKNYS
jgi:hypothetical protein